MDVLVQKNLKEINMEKQLIELARIFAEDIVKKLHNIYSLTHKSVIDDTVFLMEGDKVFSCHNDYLELQFEDGYICIGFDNITVEDIYSLFTITDIINFHKIDGVKVGITGDIVRI